VSLKSSTFQVLRKHETFVSLRFIEISMIVTQLLFITTLFQLWFYNLQTFSLLFQLSVTTR
jgi:hypothetical protein